MFAALAKKMNIESQNPHLFVGATLISEQDKEILSEGCDVVYYHITDVNFKAKTVTFFTSYKNISEMPRTVYIEQFNHFLAY